MLVARSVPVGDRVAGRLDAHSVAGAGRETVDGQAAQQRPRAGCRGAAPAGGPTCLLMHSTYARDSARFDRPMASGVGGFPQPVQPPRDQRTDQPTCFPQGHGPPGRVTLQAGMTGALLAVLVADGHPRPPPGGPTWPPGGLPAAGAAALAAAAGAIAHP